MCKWVPGVSCLILKAQRSAGVMWVLRGTGTKAKCVVEAGLGPMVQAVAPVMGGLPPEGL